MAFNLFTENTQEKVLDVRDGTGRLSLGTENLATAEDQIVMHRLVVRVNL